VPSRGWGHEVCLTRDSVLRTSFENDCALLIGDLSRARWHAIKGNLVPAFTWNAGGLGPGGINQNGIDIHINIPIDNIWLDSIIIPRVIKLTEIS
jgi:hypothetical protein